MPTLNATAGDAAANSYVTVATADTRLDESPQAATWAGLTTDAKARALMAATRELDTLPWVGWRYTNTQALSWPRRFAVNPDRAYDEDDEALLYFGADEIPARVVEATCRLALVFAVAGTEDLVKVDADAGLVAKTIGPISKTFATATRPVGLARLSGVMDRLLPLLRTAGGTTAMVRV